MQLIGLKMFWIDHTMVWNCYKEPKDMQRILDLRAWTVGKIDRNWLQA